MDLIMHGLGCIVGTLVCIMAVYVYFQIDYCQFVKKEEKYYAEILRERKNKLRSKILALEE